MKKVMLSLGVAVAQLLAVNAFAQGEVGPVKKAAPAGSASSMDGTTRAQKNAEGKEAIKMQPPGEVGAVKQAPTRSSMTREEKTAARAQKKSEAVSANKANAMPKTGEVGPTK